MKHKIKKKKKSRHQTCLITHEVLSFLSVPMNKTFAEVTSDVSLGPAGRSRKRYEKIALFLLFLRGRATLNFVALNIPRQNIDRVNF